MTPTGPAPTTPSTIQAWADQENKVIASTAAALTNVSAGVAALDTMITDFQNSPGTLSPSDQAALDGIQAASNALLAQTTAINTTAPGQPVPIVPIPVPATA